MYQLTEELSNKILAVYAATSKTISAMKDIKVASVGIVIDEQIEKLNKIMYDRVAGFGEPAEIEDDDFREIMAILMICSKIMEEHEDERLAYVGLFIDRIIDELRAPTKPELKAAVNE